MRNRFLQHDKKDCGPACLLAISRHYGLSHTLKSLRPLCAPSREGVSLYGICKAAEKLGFRASGVRLAFEQLVSDSHLPCIIHWEQRHFVVVEKAGKHKVNITDPAYGEIRYRKDEFLRGWIASGQQLGIALLLEPTPEIFRNDLNESEQKFGIRYLFPYFKLYRKFIVQLILGVLLGTFLQLTVPFLTQTIVDLGIHQRNTGMITIILLAQLVLFSSQLSVEFVRNRILLHVNSRVNISVISDFIRALIRLPLSFFETRHLGDIIQRIGDQKRVEYFLTTTFISGLYFAMNVLVFGTALLMYNLLIFAVFVMGFMLSTGWVLLFMKKRSRLDFKRFGCYSENHAKIVELVSGIADIKLANAEQQKRSAWENIQARLFNVNVGGLSIDQYQSSGAVLINQAKNLAIIFIAAIAVTKGTMTLGMMMAVIFILGQLNSPVQQLVVMARSYQEARLSLSRLGEVLEDHPAGNAGQSLSFLPDDRTIRLKNVSFSYDGDEKNFVLHNISLDIPEGKVTAIVGPSGCGKTTLLKLLLGFYKATRGNITVGGLGLEVVDKTLWRSKCGAVLQDGFIFTDSIINNITMNDDEPDLKRMVNAAEMANISDYIGQMPGNYHTVVGPNGRNLSQGQKQRLLIARALYKDPDFLLLDEATNALDAYNERSILNNLNAFIRQRTVLVIAHRLSTIKNADHILVMDRGKIIETGTHQELLTRGGIYFNLVSSQMEIDYEPQLK